MSGVCDIFCEWSLAVKPRTQNNWVECSVLKKIIKQKLRERECTRNHSSSLVLLIPVKGENVLIPRLPPISNDTRFEFKKLQFTVRLAYAMTINKSQGQSLQVCGINLEHQCFSHGQLYVACSRVGKPSSLFIYTTDGKAKNIVYERALQWIHSYSFSKTIQFTSKKTTIQHKCHFFI